MTDSTRPTTDGPSQTAGDGQPTHIFEEDLVEAMREVYDPEIPINIYDLGLIYDLSVTDENDVRVRMTLTTPNCPEAETIPQQVQQTVMRRVPGVRRVYVELVWTPQWTREMMSDDARLALGM